MGANALIAGVMCVTLPETNKQPTLETVKRELEGDEMVQLPYAEMASILSYYRAQASLSSP